ncbi:uncharacterized protein LOC107810518 [Nicotiana tabacum]|uniref:RNA-binding protein 38 n=2 Tax=Nicotiana TaxID=4085 RepID=A0A1S4BPI4_TOBAC|nr:PREDICTED: RNA-binding protein 38-like [Nicotiana sylvestris]XP_016490794.1 PREDICTED: RNA-binding protein 38-like [Nicotiana tabacum]
MAYQHYRSPFGDTTYTKVFVGGLAWETPTDIMRRYFEQFGEILEAVIIADKNTGKSKGYGFVTYRDPESARRACENPNPVIDGRRANCNIASLGRPRPSPPRGRGQGGNPYQGGGIPQGPTSSSYSGVAPAAPPPLPLPPPPATPMIYSPYGYATYPPDYYHQGMYNPQYQQAQYYQQMYGSSSSPYYYGYSMQGSRGTFSAAHPQRFQGGPAASYLYYPTTPLPADAAAAASFSSFTTPPPPLLQHPPPPAATRLQFPSPTTESQIPQQTSGETTEAGTVTTESPNT